MSGSWDGLARPTTSFHGLGGEQRLQAELREIVSFGGSADQSAEALLDILRRLMRYDAAWIARRDPDSGRHTPVLEDGQTDALRVFFSTDDADAEMQRLGLHRFGWPMPAHRLPVPLEKTLAWGGYLLPAGFCDGLAAGLFTQDGRHLGHLILLTGQPGVVTAAGAALLHTAISVVAAVVDPVAAVATPHEAVGRTTRAKISDWSTGQRKADPDR